MAKSGKIGGKLRGILKRWHSSSRLSARSTEQPADDATSNSASSHGSGGDEAGDALHTVYVGKSRRRYLINPDLAAHPLLRELAQRSGTSVDEDGDGDSGAGATVVGCEVVLFEHLLWMLENADPYSDYSLDELVELYA